jgi:hypothetical protein
MSVTAFPDVAGVSLYVRVVISSSSFSPCLSQDDKEKTRKKDNARKYINCLFISVNI